LLETRKKEIISSLAITLVTMDKKDDDNDNNDINYDDANNGHNDKPDKPEYNDANDNGDQNDDTGIISLNDNDNVPNDNKDGDIKKINFFAIAMAIDIMSIYISVTKCVIRKRIICSQTYFPKNTELQMEALKGMSIKKACEWCDVIGNEKLLCLETKKLKR